MKKFIAGLMAISLLTTGLIFTINYAYVNLKQTEDETAKFSKMPGRIEVCNLGSSHGKNSFDYTAWNDMLGCFNFALTSQRYQYDYRLLYNYSDRLEEGAVVFIPFSYFSLWGERDEDRTDFASMNNRYYKVLPPNLIIEYDPWVDVCQNYLPVLSAYDDTIDVFKDALIGDGNSNSFTEKSEDYEADVLMQYNSQILGNQDQDGNQMVNEERLEALYDIISLCKEKKAHAVLITTPLTRLFTDYVRKENPEFLDYFHKTAESIAAENNIEYYDYSEDSRINDNLEYFIDAHHLNDDGAKIFTDIVMTEIVGNYYDIK